jgi:hypothetical protein
MNDVLYLTKEHSALLWVNVLLEDDCYYYQKLVEEVTGVQLAGNKCVFKTVS